MKSMVRVLMFVILLTFPWGAVIAQEAGEPETLTDLTSATDKFTEDEVPVSACLQVRFFNSSSRLHGVIFIDLKLRTLTFPYRVVEGRVRGDICGRDWRVLPGGTVGDTLELHVELVDRRNPENCATHVDFTGDAITQPPGWDGEMPFLDSNGMPLLPIDHQHTLFMGYTECPRRP